MDVRLASGESDRAATREVTGRRDAVSHAQVVREGIETEEQARASEAGRGSCAGGLCGGLAWAGCRLWRGAGLCAEPGGKPSGF